MLGAALSFLFVSIGITFQIPRLWFQLPNEPIWYWLRGAAIAWGVAAAGVSLILPLVEWLRRRWPVREFDPGRRAVLRAAQAAALSAPVAVTGFGVFVGRHSFRVSEVNVPVAGLPADLNGLRLVQLSDIHLSPFLTESELATAVGMANEARAHLALVTGDLITRAGDPIDACLRQLARLRADAGIFGCLGNHEVHAGVEAYAARAGARQGIRFLRRESQELRFGDATLNLGGVDYQPLGQAYLAGVESLKSRRPGALNVLLSHNPDVFPAARDQGWDLTLAGHTHGGQITVEILSRQVNMARFITPYVYGLYREEKSAIYVTRGIGTVGLPARIGAAPEIGLIRLCAT